jgi:hypothetical protein
MTLLDKKDSKALLMQDGYKAFFKQDFSKIAIV